MTISPANGDSSIRFVINHFYQLQCSKCNNFIGKNNKAYYFGCLRDIYDNFPHVETGQSKLERVFDTKLELQKILTHCVCSSCAEKIDQCPIESCRGRNIQWKGFIQWSKV